MGFRGFIVACLLLPAYLLAHEHPLVEAVRQQKNIILMHGAHDTTDAAAMLENSISRGTSFEIDGNIVVLEGRPYYLNSHCPDCYINEKIDFPERAHPIVLNPTFLFPRIVDSGVFLKLDFKTPRVVEPFAFQSQVVPPHQKVGHAFVAELVVGNPKPSLEFCPNELITLKEVEKARAILGEGVPFIVSANGVTYENLTPELVDELAMKVVGHAEFFNLNLPNGGNPPTQYAEMLWTQYGLVPEIRIQTRHDRDYWNAQKFPYIGLTDDPDLATVIKE